MASVASMASLFDLMFPSSSGYSSSSFSLSSIHHISIYSLTFWWMVVSHIFNRWPVKITLRPAPFLPSAPFLFRSPLTAPFQIGWIGWIGWTNSVRPSNWWNRSNWQKKSRNEKQTDGGCTKNANVPIHTRIRTVGHVAKRMQIKLDASINSRRIDMQIGWLQNDVTIGLTL